MNPGAAATSALFEVIAERELKQRQAMLDELTQKQFGLQEQRFAADQEDRALNRQLQTESLTSLREQREAAADLNRRKKALGVIGMMQPGDAADSSTADILQQGGFGSLLNRTPATADSTPGVYVPRQGAPVGAADDPRSFVDSVGFRGTPQQQAQAAMLADPSTPENVKAYLRAIQASGDDTLPHQLFEQPDPVRGVEVVTNDGVYIVDPTDPSKRTRIGDRPINPKDAETASAGSTYSSERATRVRQSVNELLPDVGMTTVGAGARVTASIPGTPAYNFNARVNTLKANVAFNELTEMREASKTGGALGAVSEKELTLLESALGSVDTGQSPEAFKEQLNKVLASLDRWERAKSQTGAPAGPPAPTETDDERRARLRQKYGL